MKKLVIYFDSDRLRRDFMVDISELVFWNDRNREEDSRRNYEDAMTFAVPDLPSFDAEDPDAISNRLTYREADKAIDPRHVARFFTSTAAIADCH
jgi:hypothetical protein